MSWFSAGACKLVQVLALILICCQSVQDVLDPSSYLEPDDAEYWSSSTYNQDDPKQMTSEEEAQLLAKQSSTVRMTDMTSSLFDKLIRDGKVFVLPNISNGWKMRDWDCNYFSKDKQFRTAELQQNYAQGFDTPFVPFAGDWADKKNPTGVANQEAPGIAPFYWGIKDVQYEDVLRSPTWTDSMLKRVRKSFKLPHFMAAANIRFMHQTPEFWFGKPGAGAKAHMDNHIQATVSVQLAGTKRWRLRALEARRAPYLAMIYKDGDVYSRSTPWEPHYNITLSKGDALFFPPGFIHETLNVGEECASSVTFQFDYPMAVRFYRRFFPRVRRTADIHEAWPRIRMWATLDRYGAKFKAGLPFAEAKTKARDIFKVVDKNGDGIATKAEIATQLGDDHADNAIAWHDLNEDGEVVQSEFEQGFAFWAAITRGVIDETPRKWRTFQTIDMEELNIEDLPADLSKQMLRWAARRERKKTEL